MKLLNNSHCYAIKTFVPDIYINFKQEIDARVKLWTITYGKQIILE